MKAEVVSRVATGSSRFLWIALLLGTLSCVSFSVQAGHATRESHQLLHNSDFPDPAVLEVPGDGYYAYATQGFVHSRIHNIQLAYSKDLIHWSQLADAMPIKPRWAKKTQKFWAPHVSVHPSDSGLTYYMYFSAEPDVNEGLCLGVATSSSPRGPFVDQGYPMLCGNGFSNIDPMSFDDPVSGKRFFYWGSGFDPIRVRELAPDRKSFLPESPTLELIAPVPSSDPNEYSQLVEGAWVTFHEGYYYLFYSGNNCCEPNPHYAVMVARSKSPTGPFEKKEGLLLQADAKWLAPGHNSILSLGNNLYQMFFHAIDRKNPILPKETQLDRQVRRIMLSHRLVFENGWPKLL